RQGLALYFLVPLDRRAILSPDTLTERSLMAEWRQSFIHISVLSRDIYPRTPWEGSNMIDWNREIIAEFRANNGDVATAGFGRSLILVHHIGARSGLKRVNPLRAVHNSNGTWLVVASKQGAPENPD